MNTYEYEFTAKCPLNEESIKYQLTIVSLQMILCEDIAAYCDQIKHGWQEHITQKIAANYPQAISIRLFAVHADVSLTTQIDRC